MEQYRIGDTIPFLSAKGVEELRSRAKRCPESYWRGDFAWQNELATDAIYQSGIRRRTASTASVLRHDAHDSRNAMALYTTLQDLTPAQAADERLWVYLCHFEAHEYLHHRWLTGRMPERAFQRIQARYFGRTRRIWISRNGVSRLWWLGHIAHRAFPQDPELYLEAILSRQDIQANLVERPSLAMNSVFLHATARRIVDSWRDQDGLLARPAFRAWMRNLNLCGGAQLLDVLDAEALHDLVCRQADKVLEKPHTQP